MKKSAILISSLLAMPYAFAQESQTLDPVKVSTDKDLKHSLSQTSGDTAKLLDMSPGVSLQGAGGMSSLPAIHGMASDRVNIKIDQAQISSSCPNHMNPSFSYIDPSKVGSIQTMAGITPVGDGGDSIGGSIIVKTKKPEFNSKKLNVTSSFKSNNENRGASLTMGVANDNTSVSYSGFDESANNYRNGEGKRLKGTLYNQNNQTIIFARKISDSVLSLKLGRANVPYQGFINQYMDMTDNVSNSANLRLEGRMGKAFVESSIFYQHTNHFMDMIQSQRSGTMPMYTRADEAGYNVKATFDLNKTHTLRVGSDFNRYRLDDWWPAVAGSMMMGPNTFENINNGKRDRLGAFVETTSEWNKTISTNIGLRTDIVSMNTGKVQGYNNTNNLPADAAAFNSRSHIHHDRNYDATLTTEIIVTENTNLELGYARKTRSPNLYERYAWAGSVTTPPTGAASMDMMMINWFGDGNGYVGNLDLKPEVANTLSTSIEVHSLNSQDWKIKLTPYYTQVENYIDTDLLYTNARGIKFLKFANHDAVIFGADLSGDVILVRDALLGEFSLRGVAGYTRGYRKDGMTDLYNLMPLNGNLILGHAYGKWNSNLGMQLVNSKKQVNSLRGEQETAGYALLNLGTTYQATKLIKVDLSVTNLLDHNYNMPMGGIDLVNHTGAQRVAVGAVGRSLNAAVSWDFF